MDISTGDDPFARSPAGEDALQGPIVMPGYYDQGLTVNGDCYHCGAPGREHTRVPERFYHPVVRRAYCPRPPLFTLDSFDPGSP